MIPNTAQQASGLQEQLSIHLLSAIKTHSHEPRGWGIIKKMGKGQIWLVFICSVWLSPYRVSILSSNKTQCDWASPFIRVNIDAGCFGLR